MPAECVCGDLVMDIDVLEYAPIIYMDEKEPFPVRYVGFNTYTENVKSRSFKRNISLDNISRDTAMAIEYIYFLNYDIQHLYDLEHIWVYLNDAGNITGVEGSFHGKYLNAFLKGTTRFEGRHVIMYSQPGKHAMMPSPELFNLYPELFSACNHLAGVSGLDAPERYLKDIHISEAENNKVKQYIKDNFSFEPSMNFVKHHISETQYITGQELDYRITAALKDELSIILN